VTQPATPAPAIILSAHSCDVCNRALGEAMYRAGPRTICSNCAAQFAQLLQLNKFDTQKWILGALAGLGAAILSGVIWAVIVRVTNYEIGLLAIGIGIFVSWSVMKASGGKRGPSIQLLTITLSVLGIYIGKGLIVSWAVYDELVQRNEVHAGTWVRRVIIFFIGPFLAFQPFDLLWYGLAILQAWRMPKAINISLQGPFATSTGASSGGAPLQFDRVEPSAPAASPAAPSHVTPPQPAPPELGLDNSRREG
jgi:hypothetical protein